MNGTPGMCGSAKEGMSRGLKPRLVVDRNARAKARAYLRSNGNGKSKSDGDGNGKSDGNSKSNSKSDGNSKSKSGSYGLASLCDDLCPTLGGDRATPPMTMRPS